MVYLAMPRTLDARAEFDAAWADYASIGQFEWDHVDPVVG